MLSMYQGTALLHCVGYNFTSQCDCVSCFRPTSDGIAWNLLHKKLKNILQIGLGNSLSRKVDNCLLWHSVTEVISISPSVGCVFMSCRVYGLH